MALDLASLQSTISGLVPSSQDVLQQVAVGAASGVVLAGLKTQIANGALDPLGLFNHTTPAAAPSNAAPSVVSTTTITASAFAALPAAIQAQLQTAGVHIVAG